jgi:membrane associated rhomboid family serine protease/Zn-finger nucleic acid-binding protein
MGNQPRTPRRWLRPGGGSARVGAGARHRDGHSAMRCPRCRSRLDGVTLEGVRLDRCGACHGFWFDRTDLERFQYFAAEQPAPVAKSPGATPTLLTCPRRCGRLERVALPSRPTLVLDRCPDCRGMWFDEGGIARLPSGADPEVLLAEETLARTEDADRVSVGEWLFMFLTRLPREVYHPVRRFPVVMITLIVFNALAFVLLVVHPEPFGFVLAYGFTPARLRQLEAPWTLVTSMFLHGGWVHLLGNMYFLYTFGDNVEDHLGPLRFAVLYLACGLGANGVHFLAHPHDAVPAIGASGAISGLLGAYLFLFPRRRIFYMLVVLPLKLRASWYLLFWLGLQVLGALTTVPGEGGGGVAWSAHVGGFAVGLGLVALDVARRPARAVAPAPAR